MADAYFTVKERTTRRYTATIVNHLDQAIPGAGLSSLKLTLYDVATGTLLGGRPAQQDVLNLNGVTVDGNGLLEYIMTPTDNAIVGTLPHEHHIALFEFEYESSTKRGQHEVQITVINSAKVPAA